MPRSAPAPRPLKHASRAAKSSCFSLPRMGLRSPSNAAMSHAIFATPHCCARISMCASRGCVPSFAMAFPCGVIRPLSSSAPNIWSSDLACDTCAIGGKSSHFSCAKSAIPHCANSSNKGAKSAPMISAAACGLRWFCSTSLHSR